MAILSWLCTSSTKNMLIKIVHPGGHVELHDRPVLAAEVMTRNPGCCVAHPHVFRQPWAIVERETTLMPGNKFYVVPIGTIRKLQRNALKYSPSLVRQIRSGQSSKGEEEDVISSPKLTYGNSTKPNAENQCCLSDDSCFIMGLLKGMKTQQTGDEYSSQETGTPSSSTSSSSEVKLLTRKRPSNFRRPQMKGSPKKLSLDHWQPSLESIKEE